MVLANGKVDGWLEVPASGVRPRSRFEATFDVVEDSFI